VNRENIAMRLAILLQANGDGESSNITMFNVYQKKRQDMSTFLHTGTWLGI